MYIDLTQDAVVAWAGQFSGNDEDIALRFLKNLMYVSADDFFKKLLKLVTSRFDEKNGPIALYAERKLILNGHPIKKLFKEETKGIVSRAFGDGPAPVQSENEECHETGSEGIVANLITQVVRGNRDKFFDHPGPDVIRKKKIRRFILVTDFIGSGSQSFRYLNAAWAVASIKSWKSGKFIRFEVVCFSACDEGLKKLQKHPSKPEIHQVISCPTLSTFQPYKEKDFISLCKRYGPTNSKARNIPRLGYGKLGAMIVFSHGVPNNAPRLLFKGGKNWEPLFPERSTGMVAYAAFEEIKDSIARRLETLQESNIARLMSDAELDPKIYLSILVMAALKKSPRTPEVVSARTGLGLAHTMQILKSVRDAEWIDDQNRLTSRAYKELNYLRGTNKEKVQRYRSNSQAYFP